MFHLMSSCKTFVFWVTQFKKRDLEPTSLLLTPFTDDETDTQGISWVLDPRPPDAVPTSFPSATPAPVCFASGGVKKKNPNEPKLKSGVKKKALLIPVTIFFLKA